MLSAEDIASVKLSVEICDKSELKREILCAPGSEYDMNRNRDDWDDWDDDEDYQYRKGLWNEIIEGKSAIILEKLGLPRHLKDKVMSVVLSVGKRMLIWAEYHEGTLGFSREYSIHFLNSSFFTTKGIIDNKRAAEELMNDRSLSIKQKYKLACLYCFKEHIPPLYRQMAKSDKKEFYHTYPWIIRQPRLVKFWTYYLMGEIDKLKENKKINQYRLETAIESGSKAAVEYCFEETNVRRRTAVVDAAIETLINRNFRSDIVDTVVLGDLRYKDNEQLWVPTDYYVDILCFLFSRMGEDQKIEVLKKDIEGAIYKTDFRNPVRSRVLEYFLNSPYQCYFMKTAELMWDFLPERSYAYLLLLICDKIEPKNVTINYGEEKSYDYRSLLRVFWSQSPERYKRYLLRDKEIINVDGFNETLKEGKELLVRLLTLNHFTYEDKDNIEEILDSATDEEKENIIYSEEVGNACFKLMEEERWKLLDAFVSIIFSSNEQAVKFKREWSFMEGAKCVCITFIKDDKWNAAESFICWSYLPEEEIIQLKREMASSNDGKRACMDLFFHKGVEIANKFCEWCFSSEEEINPYKKELVLWCSSGILRLSDLALEYKLELINEFINWGLLSEAEIREFMRNVDYVTVSSVCKKLISYYTRILHLDNKYDVIGVEIEFNGGQWEQVEKFLTWRFSSEEEINDFKTQLLTMEGELECRMGFLIEIHFDLMTASKWEEAEIFFTWLGLSFEEIRELKKETLLCRLGMGFIQHSFDESNIEKFSNYAGGKWEKIELYLRWCLIDKDAVLEFWNRCDEVYGFKSRRNELCVDELDISEYERDVLYPFILLIKELLNDMS